MLAVRSPALERHLRPPPRAPRLHPPLRDQSIGFCVLPARETVVVIPYWLNNCSARESLPAFSFRVFRYAFLMFQRIKCPLPSGRARRGRGLSRLTDLADVPNLHCINCSNREHLVRVNRTGRSGCLVIASANPTSSLSVKRSDNRPADLCSRPRTMRT